MMEYSVRRMRAGDVSAVAALEKECFADPWSERSIGSELDNPLSLWLIAEADGSLLGYIGSQSVLDEADMMNVAVAPAARRQGIAERLIVRLIEELTRAEVGSLALEVRVSNEPARALYNKLGFSEAGIRKNYYRNPREDALILRKQWSESR